MHLPTKARKPVGEMNSSCEELSADSKLILLDPTQKLKTARQSFVEDNTSLMSRVSQLKQENQSVRWISYEENCRLTSLALQLIEVNMTLEREKSQVEDAKQKIVDERATLTSRAEKLQAREEVR